ncbi:ArnT family glycosyltransferase [Levilactobacillus brevis]|uniref:ArnT family glycosyltransferase n=1 Tax=Levilactobacillus brevis TaxID=1580 RepID=UPI002012FEFB|nr:teichoic acid glycosyl transferase [Levilactobacillus brevis]
MKSLKIKLSSKLYLFLFLLVSIWFMSFCSYTSPFFYFDYSPDNNCFFTVGKALMHGILPYKDVFEQKGPYVYLIHGIAYLINHYSLVGIFPFEVISLFFTICIVYKISLLYTGREYAYVVAILSPIFQLFHPYYDYGDTVESLLFPAMLSLIYVLLQGEKNNFNISRISWGLQGFLVGLTFLMKYTLLGSWIIFYISVFTYYFVHKLWRKIGKLIQWSLIGFLLAVLPWLIFFVLTKSLPAFIHVYFYENMHVYMLSNNSFFAKFIESLTIYSSFLRNDPLIFLCGFLGYVYLLISNTTFKTTVGKTIFVLMMIANGAFVIYGYHSSQVYQYYELAFFPYLLVPATCIIIRLLNHFKFKVNFQNESFVIMGSILISFFLVLGVNNNILSSRIFPNNASVTLRTTNHPQEPAQIVFGNIMRKESNSRPTMLNYGSIDMGFYTTSGALPSNYYFQNYNISYQKDPHILNDQQNIIRRHKVQWIVLNTPEEKTIRQWKGDPLEKGKISDGNINPGTSKIAYLLLKNYYIITHHTQSFESTNVTYWLLKRRSLDKDKHKAHHNEITIKRNFLH